MRLTKNIHQDVMRLFVPLPLVFCVVICIFYRTANNHAHLLFDLLTFGNLAKLKAGIQSILPLNNLLIYSIPEGLWVFSMTLLGSLFFVNVSGRKIHLTHLAVLFALFLEGLQFFHFTNGTFDIWDILASILFWMIGHLMISNKAFLLQERSVFDFRVYFFLLAFCSVYFSDTIVG